MEGLFIAGKKLLRVHHQGQTKNIVVLRENGSTELFRAHLLVEKINAELGTNLTVISPIVADVALSTENVARELPCFPVDALIAYEKPDKSLGSEIVFQGKGEPRIVLATGKYKGEKNIALVALGLTSEDFKRDDNFIFLDIPDSRLIDVREFPIRDGWYMLHHQTCVPHGNEVGMKGDTSHEDARYLDRVEDSSFIGLMVRNGGGWQSVDADYGATGEFGVVAEVHIKDIERIQALLPKVGDDQTEKRVIIDIRGISTDELRGLLERFGEDLKTLAATTKDELLAAGLKLKATLSVANFKE